MPTCSSTWTSRPSAVPSSTTTFTTPTRRARSASTRSRIAARARPRRACARLAWRSDAAAMARESAREFEHWLAEGGLRNMPLSDLFNGFTQFLTEGGVPIGRAYFGMSTRHPLIEAFDMTWEPESALYHTQFDHTWQRRSAWVDSPLRHMIHEHLPRMRRALKGQNAVLDFPIFQELSGRGFTDWYGAINGFEADSILEQPGSLGMACSWSTDHPGGFSNDNLALINRLFPIFAVSVKAS